MDTAETYPGLAHKASELSAFGVTMGIYVISLKNSDLIRFTPDDPRQFRNWLSAHGVRDIDQKQENKNTVDTSEIKSKRRGLF